MNAVVENSTQYLTQDDLNAIAHYLKDTSGIRRKAIAINRIGRDVAVALSALITGETELPGAGIYNSFCAKCHQETGIR